MSQILAGRREIGVWLLLVVATVLSLVLGIDAHTRLTSVGLLVVALVKVWLIGRDFMEIRGAPTGLRVALNIYVGGVGAALVVIYAVG